VIDRFGVCKGGAGCQVRVHIDTDSIEQRAYHFWVVYVRLGAVRWQRGTDASFTFRKDEAVDRADERESGLSVVSGREIRSEMRRER
jgi:hypothetical protein